MHVIGYRTLTAREPCARAAKAPTGKSTLAGVLLVPADGKCCDHQRKGSFSALYIAKALIARAQLRAIHAVAAEWPSGDSGNMYVDLLAQRGRTRRGGGAVRGKIMKMASQGLKGTVSAGLPRASTLAPHLR